MPKLDEMIEHESAGSMIMAKQGNLTSSSKKTEKRYWKRENSSSKVSQAELEKSVKVGNTMTSGRGLTLIQLANLLDTFLAV